MTESLNPLVERAAVVDVIKALFIETLFRFNVKFLDGNLELEADAAAPEPVRV